MTASLRRMPITAQLGGDLVDRAGGPANLLTCPAGRPIGQHHVRQRDPVISLYP